MAAGERLPLAWFQRPTPVVARALIGCVLVHGDRAGRIVETEAYLGPEDRASHARFGPTARNRVMFGPGGVTYVYLCYGIHQMFNIVSDRDGQAGAVLVRAIAPVAGLPDDPPADPAVGRGPGKVTRALGLGPAQHGRTLDTDALHVRAGRPGAAIVTTARIGVDYAGPWARRRLRFALAGHPAVSRPR
ncbi:MAG: DNA-3-methyladenine glycosylase [Myxococcales bacterium]|nr:DNA-3-methyladenine glycosylase [Myxococcales bacterium]